MEEIPGSNVTEGARRERRKEDDAHRSGELPDMSRTTHPCCCTCGRDFQEGMRYSWTKDPVTGKPDGRMRCASCTAPGEKLEVFV